MSTYNSTSPYYLTGINEFYLDVMVNRPLPKESDDQVIVIHQT